MNRSFQLSTLVVYVVFKHLNVSAVLMQFTPDKFVETMKLMEHRYGANDFVTSQDINLLSPGTFYLTEVDTMYRRFYSQKAGDKANGTQCEKGSLTNGR